MPKKDKTKPEIKADTKCENCEPALILNEAIAVLDRIVENDAETIIRAGEVEDFFGAVMETLWELREMMYYKQPTGKTCLPKYIAVFDKYNANNMDRHTIMSEMNALAFAHRRERYDE